MVSACICIFAGNSPAYVMIMWYVRVGHSPSEVSTTNYITILQINCSVINSRILLTTTAYNLILSIIILQSCIKLIHNVVSYLHFAQIFFTDCCAYDASILEMNNDDDDHDNDDDTEHSDL